jgi:hypothetical protein
MDVGFVRYWAARKRLGVADRSGAKWKEAFQELAAASRIFPNEEAKHKESIYTTSWQEITRPLDGEMWPPKALEAGKGYAVNPEASPFFRFVVFLKLGITFRELITELEKDRSSYAKLLKVHRDYERLHVGKASVRDLKLKFNLDHFSIMLQGLAYGLNELSELELAACFDEICPCAQRHSVEWLKKFRTRVKKACEHLQESKNEPTTINM